MKDFNIQVLAKAMSLRMKKHSVIASNIANADTPGYRPNAVSFEEKLQKAVSSQSSGRLNQISANVEKSDDIVPRLDGNSVSLDKQLATLTENSMVYSATAEFLKKKIGMLKKVIS